MASKREAERAKKRAAREQTRKPDEGDTKYGRKHRYLNKHGLWGFEVPEPKPWK